MKRRIQTALLAYLLLIACLCSGMTSCQNDDVPSETQSENMGELPPEEQIIVKNSNPLQKYFMSNPLGVTGIGDPVVLYDNGMYYMYATSIGVGFKVWKTANPSSWTSAGIAYQKSSTTFGEINYCLAPVRVNNNLSLLCPYDTAKGGHLQGKSGCSQIASVVLTIYSPKVWKMRYNDTKTIIFSRR